MNIHEKRLNVLINHVQKHDEGNGLILRRKDVLKIVGISEGDSAKALFKLIDEEPTLYEQRMKVVTEKRKKKYFAIKKTKEKTNIDNLNVKINSSKNKSKEIQKPTHNIKEEKNIINKNLEQQQQSDNVILNVSKDGQGTLIYKDNKFAITNSTIDILHKKHSPNSISISMILECISKNPLKDNLIFPTYDIENKLIKEIIENSALNNKVDVKNSILEISDKNNIVTFDTLVDAFKLNYGNIETQQEYEAIKDYLVKFFNELLNLIPEFNNYELRLSSQKNFLIAENLMFYGYMSIAKYLYIMDDWQQYMNNILQIDFNKDSTIWYGKVTKKDKKKEMYYIINKNSTKSYIIQRIEKEFSKLINQLNK